MRYYSDKLNKIFNSEDELKVAESEYDKAKAEEASSLEMNRREKEVSDAYKNYKSLLNKFNEDYGRNDRTYLPVWCRFF